MLVFFQELHRPQRLVGEPGKAVDVPFRELQRAVAVEVEAEDLRIGTGPFAVGLEAGDRRG